MTTLQDEAAAMLGRIDAAEAAKRVGELSPEDRAMILRLGAKGNATQQEIAKVVGCNQSTVSRVLAMLDTRKEARTILESGAARLADTVVNTDDAAIALKALGKLDVVRDDKSGADGGDAIVISLGYRFAGSAAEFIGFQVGDRIAMACSPIPSLDGREIEPQLTLERPLGGGAMTSFNIPEDVDLSALPEGVIVADDAYPAIARRGMTAGAAKVRQAMALTPGTDGGTDAA
jgi:hypothetical protein